MGSQQITMNETPQTPAVRNQNPGNLKDPQTGTFRSFKDPLEGKAALYNDLTAKMTGTSTTGINGGSSLVEFAKVYAPAGDKNDPIQYAANLANKLGVSPDEKIGSLLPRIDDFASAVASNEDPSAKYTQHPPIQGVQPSVSEPNADGYITNVQTEQKPQQKEEGVSYTPQGDTLGAKLGGRIKDVSNAVTDFTQNKQGLISTGLQTAGAVAGGLGDITTSIIEHTPLVGWALKGIEKTIGTGIDSFAKTESGQEVFRAINDFTQKNPEASKNIGAVVNIVSAIPILKGLSVAKNVVLDTASLGLKRVAENAMKNELPKYFTSRTGQKVLSRNPNGISAIIRERAIPDVEDGKYVVKNAVSQLDDGVSALDDKLDDVLKAKTGNATPLTSIEQMRNNALTLAKESAEGEANYKTIVSKINEMFDMALDSDKAIAVSGGKFLNLSDANIFKRRARVGLNFDDNVGRRASFYVQNSYMKAIEDIATKEGLGDVKGINKAMGELLEGMNILEELNGKKLLISPAKGVVQTGATAGGGFLGATAGVSPEVSAYIGNRLGGAVGNTFSGVKEGILRRTGTGAQRTSAKDFLKKGIGYSAVGSIMNQESPSLQQKGLLQK